MEKLIKVFIGIIIILILIIGVFVGTLLTMNMFNYYDALNWKASCDDGCSIATKDNQGFLTNKTFECWDKCDKYITEVAWHSSQAWIIKKKLEEEE